MALPVRTTLDDVLTICGYLTKKPTGATLQEAKAVLGPNRLDPRKISALKYWEIIEDQDERLRITPEGRKLAKSSGPERAAVFASIIRNIDPYRSVIERAAHLNEQSLTATDVATHWHDHYRNLTGTSEDHLNDQAVCFFHIAQGAELGTMVVGRGRGAVTKIDFNQNALTAFADEESFATPLGVEGQQFSGEEAPPASREPSAAFVPSPTQTDMTDDLGKAIFIAHGKNKKPLEQLRRILDQFKIQYKVAIDEPNLGRPISAKVRETMQACNCAILIFTADEEFKDKDGRSIWRPSENVVYELGASSYLYGNRIVIMKEDSVDFPSNFRDIGYISFANDQLEAKAMEILRELIGFEIVKVST